MMCETVNECRQALQAMQSWGEWSWHLGHPASAEGGGSSWAAQARRGLDPALAICRDGVLVRMSYPLDTGEGSASFSFWQV